MRQLDILKMLKIHIKMGTYINGWHFITPCSTNMVSLEQKQVFSAHYTWLIKFYYISGDSICLKSLTDVLNTPKSWAKVEYDLKNQLNLWRESYPINHLFSNITQIPF